MRYCYSSPLSRILPPHFQWSLRPSPPSRGSSESVARPSPWMTRPQAAGFVCFGGANSGHFEVLVKVRGAWEKHKPPRSTKKETQYLRDRNSCSYNLANRGFTGQFDHATLAGLQCDEFWWKKSSVTSFKMSCSRNAYNSRNRLEKPSPLDYDNSKVCMLYNIYKVSEISPDSNISILQFPLRWLVLELIRCVYPNHAVSSNGTWRFGEVMNQAKPLKQHEDVCG